MVSLTGHVDWPDSACTHDGPVHVLAGSWPLSGRLIAEEKLVVNHTCKHATEERADPVDAVVSPMMSGESGAERTSGVQGGAREGACNENVHRDCEADGKAGSPRERAPGVHRRRKIDKYENKGRQTFKQHAVNSRKVGSEIGGAESHRPPDGFRNDCDEQVCGCHRADQLA